jgi:anthranilate synthase component 2
MNTLIIDNNTKNLFELKEVLYNKGMRVTVITRQQFSVEFCEPFDLIVFSGGSHIPSVKNHSEVYKSEIDFIRTNITKPVIGICLGCELVAVAFGGSLTEMDAKHQGIRNINYLGNFIQVYESHRFIITSVPPELEILATSEEGIEAIRHKIYPIYGIQFHPEIKIENNNGVDVLGSILEKIKIQ